MISIIFRIIISWQNHEKLAFYIHLNRNLNISLDRYFLSTSRRLSIIVQKTIPNHHIQLAYIAIYTDTYLFPCAFRCHCPPTAVLAAPACRAPAPADTAACLVARTPLACPASWRHRETVAAAPMEAAVPDEPRRPRTVAAAAATPPIPAPCLAAGSLWRNLVNHWN